MNCQLLWRVSGISADFQQNLLVHIDPKLIRTYALQSFAGLVFPAAVMSRDAFDPPLMLPCFCNALRLEETLLGADK